MAVQQETEQEVADFAVSNQGSIWLFTPQTEWANELCLDGTISIADWQWMGDSFGVDHRMGADLVENLQYDLGVTFERG